MNAAAFDHLFLVKAFFRYVKQLSEDYPGQLHLQPLFN